MAISYEPKWGSIPNGNWIMNKGRLFIVVGLMACFIVAGGLVAYEMIGKRRAKLPPSPEFQIRHPDLVTQGITEMKSSGMAEKLYEFERIMDRFYRGDPLGQTQISVNCSVDNYNKWTQAKKAEIEAEGATLEEQLESLRQLETQIKALDHRLEGPKRDPYNKSLVQAYNSLVAQRNELVKKHNELGRVYKESERAYNNAVDRLNQEVAVRKERVAGAKRDAEEEVRAYRRWVDSRQDMVFFGDLNRFYALLHEEKRRISHNTNLDRHLEEVRAIRRELGDYAIRKQEDAKNGLIIVRAILCGREEGFFIVDTGATLVTISLELIKALGLTDLLGNEIEVILAGGIRIKGRELLIPKLSVFGMEAEDVKAVVLKEPETGVDGLLGHSFLNRFAYRIDDSRSEKLILDPSKSG